jgi:hypothetical protein
MTSATSTGLGGLVGQGDEDDDEWEDVDSSDEGDDMDHDGEEEEEFRYGGEPAAQAMPMRMMMGARQDRQYATDPFTSPNPRARLSTFLPFPSSIACAHPSSFRTDRELCCGAMCCTTRPLHDPMHDPCTTPFVGAMCCTTRPLHNPMHDPCTTPFVGAMCCTTPAPPPLQNGGVNVNSRGTPTNCCML